MIDAADFECVMPLLPAASMQSAGELQDLRAALFESAATADVDYLPSFGQTLSQLTAEEAKFLDRLWKFVTQPRPDLSPSPVVQVIYPSHLAQDHGQLRLAPALNWNGATGRS